MLRCQQKYFELGRDLQTKKTLKDDIINNITSSSFYKICMPGHVEVETEFAHGPTFSFLFCIFIFPLKKNPDYFSELDFLGMFLRLIEIIWI